MADIKELEKKINVLEGQITILTKQNKELRNSLSETPKTVISFEELLLNNIRKSNVFRECCEKYNEGSLKNLSISYNIKELKKITSELEKIEGVGYTKPIDTNNSREGMRERVENSIKSKDKKNVRDNIKVEAYTYE